MKLYQRISLIFITVILTQGISAQKYKSSWLLVNNPSVATEARRSFDLSGEAFIFGKGQSFFAGRLAFYYGIGGKRKHFAGIEVPFIISDYAGAETRMGMGDMRIMYHFFPYRDNSGERSFQAFGIGVEAFAPIGKESQGLSRESWVLYINATSAIRPHHRWAIYPSARYIFSFDSTYSISIAGPPFNLPEPLEQDAKEMVSSLQASSMVVFEFPKVAAYIGTTPEFLYDFTNKKGSFAWFSKIGKMFTEKFGISMAWAIQIAGQKSYSNAFHLGLIHYLK